MMKKMQFSYGERKEARWFSDRIRKLGDQKVEDFSQISSLKSVSLPQQALLIVSLLQPQAPELTQIRQNTPTLPHRIDPIFRRYNLVVWNQLCQFFLQSWNQSFKKCWAAPQHYILEKVPPQLRVTGLDRVDTHLMESGCFRGDKSWVEKDFGSHESFLAASNFDPVWKFVLCELFLLGALCLIVDCHIAEVFLHFTHLL